MVREIETYLNGGQFSPYQVYGPCILLVVISWVSFWLNREATSDRISLGEIVNSFCLIGVLKDSQPFDWPTFSGVTTVLTMTFLGLEARTDLPQVAYPTALDYFVFLSFMFIFSTVVQVCIHFMRSERCRHKKSHYYTVSQILFLLRVGHFSHTEIHNPTVCKPWDYDSTKIHNPMVCKPWDYGFQYCHNPPG